MSGPFVRDRFTWVAYGMLAYFAFLQAALGPLMPFLRAEQAITFTVAGLHFSAFALGMVLAGLVGDRLAGRWGRWPLFWGGALGMAAGTLLLAAGATAPFTVAGTFLMGVAGTCLLVMIQATLSDRHLDRRTVALTESNVAASVAAAAAPLAIGAFVSVGMGWRSALYLAAAAGLLAFVRYGREPLPLAHQDADPRSEGSRPQRALTLAFWGYWAVICLAVSAEWSMIFWGADFLETVGGFARVTAATLMAVFLGAAVVGRVLGSRLARSLPSEVLLLLAETTALLGFPLFWLARSPLLQVAGLFIAGLGIGNLFPLGLSAAVTAAAAHANTASARVSLGAGLAILISPLLLGSWADRVGLQRAFSVVAVILLAAVVVTLLVFHRTRRR